MLAPFRSKLPSAEKNDEPVEKCLDEMLRSGGFDFFWE